MSAIAKEAICDFAQMIISTPGIIFHLLLNFRCHMNHSENSRGKVIKSADAVIERPMELKEAAVLQVYFTGSETWFITEKGMWAVNTKKLLKRLKGA